MGAKIKDNGSLYRPGIGIQLEYIGKMLPNGIDRLLREVMPNLWRQIGEHPLRVCLPKPSARLLLKSRYKALCPEMIVIIGNWIGA